MSLHFLCHSGFFTISGNPRNFDYAERRLRETANGTFLSFFLGSIKNLLPSITQLSYISDCNWTRPHNHLIRKRTLNHLAKLTVVIKGSSAAVSLCGNIFLFHF